MTPQAKMKATLEKSGIPSKDIKVFGSQILITAWSEDAARKWAALLATFATVRGVVESLDDNVDQAAWFKDRPGIVKMKATHKVWRVGAYIPRLPEPVRL